MAEKARESHGAMDDETIVLAAMIQEETAAETARLCYAAKLDPEAMFTDMKVRDNYYALKHHGPGIFCGYLFGVPVKHLAANGDIEGRIGRIVRRYKRKLAETDRTLDAFETPGPDSEDPDCLFQNRWLRRGACGAVVSTSGVGKSSFTMQASVMWAAGQECLGIRPLRPLKIGIFQSEDDEYDVANFRDHIRVGLFKELGWDAGMLAEAERRVTFCALNGATGARFVEYVREKQLINHFDLIIINPLFAFFGGDLNDGVEMTEFLRHGIDPLIKDEATKCGCLIVHHTGKPRKELLENGDVFAAYLGSGSGEFTNYVRSALVITPYDKKGAMNGMFTLYAAKHGDKLGWRDGNGVQTLRKTVCYANKLPHCEDEGEILWVEPDAAQLAEMTAPKETVSTEPTTTPEERCALLLAERIRTAWTPTMKPNDAGNGQREWLMHLSGTGFTRTTRGRVYDFMREAPGRWGLRLIATTRHGRGYLVGNSAGAAAEEEPLEQEDFGC